MSEKLQKIVAFMKKHWIIISVIAYGIGILFQAIPLFLNFWFVGLSYISIPFSLVIFAIILFLVAGSVLLFIVLLLISALTMSWRWLIATIVIAIFAYSFKFFLKKYQKRIDLFALSYCVFVFLLVIFSLVIATFSYKVATINYGEDKTVMGKMLFYNQDDYFLEVCWEKMIIPVEQVESVEIVAESYMFSSMKSEEINKINQKYNDFCREYLQK